MKKLFLIILVVAMLAAPSMAQKTTSSTISADNRSAEEKLKDGLEMTVCIKYEKEYKKVDCEMIIKVKKDYKGTYNEQVEKAIVIEMTKGFYHATSTTSKDKVPCNDRVLYIKYKERYKKKGFEDLWLFFSRFKKLRRFSSDMLKERLVKCKPDLKFTYIDFFQVIEELLYHDKAILDGVTIYMKKREFKEIPHKTFEIQTSYRTYGH